MLKRQRQSSPPPFASSSVPLAADSPGPDEAAFVRDIKRRRTRPPVLDGMERGWNLPNDEEEYYEEDDDERTVSEYASLSEIEEY